MKMDDNEVIVGRFKPVQNLNKIDWKPVRLTPGTSESFREQNSSAKINTLSSDTSTTHTNFPELSF